jgi:hypothetical protein
MPSPIPRQVRWKLVRSYLPIGFGLPRIGGESAPALSVSRPAQRSLTSRPTCSPSRLCDLLHRRLQQLRCLRRCFGCYRVERTSSRRDFSPAEDQRLFTAHSGYAKQESEIHWGKMQDAPQEKNLRRVGQYVRPWKRWVLSGMRDVIVDDAFKLPAGPGLNVSASMAATQFRRA